MRSVRIYDLMTLDGVIQAPHPNEEFEHAGWAVPYQDEVMLSNATQGMDGGGALLLGRRTYESMAAAWPNAPNDNPFTGVMNNYKKTWPRGRCLGRFSGRTRSCSTVMRATPSRRSRSRTGRTSSCWAAAT